jgi:hypothetical protein
MKSSVAMRWAARDDHFREQTKLIGGFRHARADAVRRMRTRQEEVLRLSLRTIWRLADLTLIANTSTRTVAPLEVRGQAAGNLWHLVGTCHSPATITTHDHGVEKNFRRKHHASQTHVWCYR